MSEHDISALRPAMSDDMRDALAALRRGLTGFERRRGRRLRSVAIVWLAGNEGGAGAGCLTLGCAAAETLEVLADVLQRMADDAVPSAPERMQ